MAFLSKISKKSIFNAGISTIATEAEGLCTNRKKNLVMKESYISASYDKRRLQQVMYYLVVALLSSLDNMGSDFRTMYLILQA